MANSSKIFVMTYEVVGAGISIAEAHHTAIDAAKTLHWNFVEGVGGVGFRPAHHGSIQSVFFKNAAPSGWKKIGTDKGFIEATPRKTSVDGKAFANTILELPHTPTPITLAAHLGYNPAVFAIDREKGTIYFPTEIDVEFPAKRYFIRLPRFANDAFEPDPNMLNELLESEFMRALEEHNSEARRRQANIQSDAA